MGKYLMESQYMVNSYPQISNGLPPVEAQVNASTLVLADWLQDSIHHFVERGQVQTQLHCVVGGFKLLTGK